MKRIIIFPLKHDDKMKKVIRDYFNVESFNKTTGHAIPLFEELNIQEANRIITGSAPAEAQMIDRKFLTQQQLQQQQQQLNSSNPQPAVKTWVLDYSKSFVYIFSPLGRLFVYPPPPNKGGIPITIDDFNCLEEEQFLNDVILDFYLK